MLRAASEAVDRMDRLCYLRRQPTACTASAVPLLAAAHALGPTESTAEAAQKVGRLYCKKWADAVVRAGAEKVGAGGRAVKECGTLCSSVVDLFVRQGRPPHTRRSSLHRVNRTHHPVYSNDIE